MPESQARFLWRQAACANGCWVQLNAIGVAKPLSLFVEMHGTEQGLTSDEITNVLNKEGDRTPGPLVVYPNSPRTEDFSRCPSWTFDHSLVCHVRPPTDGQVCGEEWHERTVLGAAVARDCRRQAALAVSMDNLTTDHITNMY